MYKYQNQYEENSWLKMLRFWEGYKLSRGMLFGAIILGAMLAFEVFNYTTTDFALTDLLGNMDFFGVRWAVILSLAFCGMDFAGLARLFTPEKGRDERLEVWYLIGAWFLAATMNAMLTWWGVSIALLSHQSLGNEILSRDRLLAIVPVFVAVLVWLIRILLIGTFSMAGERLFAQADTNVRRTVAPTRSVAHVAPKAAPVRPARLLGDEEFEEYDQRPRQPEPQRAPVRPAPVAPSVRPAPAIPVVRPAPKPSTSFAGPSNGNLRPSVTRAESKGQIDPDWQ